MDLVGYERKRFEDDRGRVPRLRQPPYMPSPTAIPISALGGDNVFRRSDAMRWYPGPSLVEHLERLAPEGDELAREPLRLPVQMCPAPPTSAAMPA